MTSEEEPVFKVPIAYLDDKKALKQDIDNDLELTSGENPFYETLFNANNEFRKLTIPQQAKYFTDNKKYLSETQKLLASGIPVPTESEPIMKIRKTLIDNEDFLSKYDYVEWNMLKFLNENTSAMQWMSIYNISSPVLSLALPIIMLIIPFFLIRLQNSDVTWESYYKYLQVVLKNHSLGQIFYIGSASWDKRVMIIVSLIFYLVQVYFNFQSCVKFIKNMKEIHANIFVVRDYLTATITAMNDIDNEWKVYKTYEPFVNRVKEMRSKAKILCNKLNEITPCRVSISKALNLGSVMSAWYTLNMDQQSVETIEYCIQLNSYLHNMTTVADKIDSSELGKATFSDSKTKFTGVYYPHLETEPIHNDVDLSKNIIITGPNAAGKTTILKSTMFAIITSQQLGIGYYDRCILEPYSVLHSYINIPDTSGRDSLFQAEASRCKSILREISENKSRHFCIFDELFSGTNPYEAISAANAYLSYINKNKNVRYVLTTHFLDLCKKLDKKKGVRNMHMHVAQKGGDFVYNYKLQKGISTVKGGIKVLRDLAYPDEIVLNSIKTINKLKI